MLWPEWSRKYDEVSVVYFILAEHSKHVKIGVTTDPQRRLEELQTGHHERLRLVSTVPGGPSEEKSYHRRFSKYRAHGEWFKVNGALKEFIERLDKGNKDASSR